MVRDIIDSAGDPMILRVSDDNFNDAVTFAKETIADAKWQGKNRFNTRRFCLEFRYCYYMLDAKGKYERHTYPERTPEELDEAMDEYWIFYDQLDEDGEQ